MNTGALFSPGVRSSSNRSLSNLGGVEPPTSDSPRLPSVAPKVMQKGSLPTVNAPRVHISFRLSIRIIMAFRETDHVTER